ncbi:MAG: dihydropteroate synthase [Candidatus Omnitrophota bacterium]
MFVIGERINGMYRQIAKAIAEKDAGAIHEVARAQAVAGADALDINVGPAAADPVMAMRWLVTSVREVVSLPLSIDSTNKEVVEAGLASAGPGAIINSTSADEDRLGALLPLAKKYDARIIGLAMSKKGVPRDRAGKSELALMILAACVEHDISPTNVYIDPIVLPVNVAQQQARETLESIREFQVLSDPPPQTIIGLSNISQGARERALINRTFLVMAVFSGLTAAIMDPLDTQLMDAMISAELVLNKNIYCDSYLDAYRKR